MEPAYFESAVSPYALLSIAIVLEVFATSALRATEGFTRLGPSVGVLLGYGISFYCLSIVTQHIAVGVTYAVWSGMGIVLVSGIGWVWYQQPLDWAARIGMLLIIAGVLVLFLLSDSTHGKSQP
jgi:small multidrug resistance pump